MGGKGGQGRRGNEDSGPALGFLFLYTRHIYPLNLEHGTKKNTSTNSSYNAVHINYCSYS